MKMTAQTPKSVHSLLLLCISFTDVWLYCFIVALVIAVIALVALVIALVALVIKYRKK